jgi:hypothetical protein
MQDRIAVRASLQLAALSLIGLLAGAWAFVAPWVVGFPTSRPGDWTSSMWSNVWIGAVVVGSSAVGLVTALGLALAAALRSSRAERGADTRPNSVTDRGA